MRSVRKTLEAIGIAAGLMAAVACASPGNGPQLAGPIMEARINGGPTVLSGTVVNEAAAPAADVTVTFVIYDKSGKGSTVTAVVNDGAPLALGDTADFSVSFDGPAEQIDYSIGYNDQAGSLYVLR